MYINVWNGLISGLYRDGDLIEVNFWRIFIVVAIQITLLALGGFFSSGAC